MASNLLREENGLFTNLHEDDHTLMSLTACLVCVTISMSKPFCNLFSSKSSSLMRVMHLVRWLATIHVQILLAWLLATFMAVV